MLALLLTACGGKSAEDKAAEEKAKAVAVATAKKESQQASLNRYLAQSKVANGFYQRGRSLGLRSVAQAKGQDIDGAVVADSAKLLRRASTSVAEASVRQRLATAPVALRSINVRFAKDMGEMADYWDELGGALRAKDVNEYNATTSTAGGAVRNEWRLQVQAHARRLGVTMPAWARIIGTNP